MQRSTDLHTRLHTHSDPGMLHGCTITLVTSVAIFPHPMRPCKSWCTLSHDGAGAAPCRHGGLSGPLHAGRLRSLHPRLVDEADCHRRANKSYACLYVYAGILASSAMCQAIKNPKLWTLPRSWRRPHQTTSSGPHLPLCVRGRTPQRGGGRVRRVRTSTRKQI